MTTEEWNQVYVAKDQAEFKAERPSYEIIVSVAKHIAGFPGDEIEGDDALRLIGLVSQLTMLARVKNPSVTPINILTKAYGSGDTKGAMQQYNQIAVMCELFMTPNAKFSMYNLTTVAEMLQEIKRIMDMWLPF